MKKILHISKYYYPFRGGTEQVARDCVNALKNDYDQEVICFGEEKSDSEDRVDGIRVVRAGCFTKISSQSLSFSYGRLLKAEIEEYKPDIIVFHYPNPFVASLLLKQIPYSCKLVVYWHMDIVKQRVLKLLFIRQNKQLISRANLIIATSPNYVEGSHYLSNARNKCAVIPNCVNEERLAINRIIEKKASEIRDKNAGKTICVSFGRHTKYKGLDYLINAAHLLDDSFVFFLIGKGEETKNLRKLAKGDKKIVFLGSLEETELKAYMLAMDIFCFPSITKNEAFGLSLAEAMYYEKPAVTFTIQGSGVNYVCLNGENGIEVPNKDVRQYVDALRKLADDVHLRTKMGIAGKKRVEERFSILQFNPSLIRAMDEL